MTPQEREIHGFFAAREEAIFAASGISKVLEIELKKLDDTASLDQIRQMEGLAASLNELLQHHPLLTNSQTEEVIIAIAKKHLNLDTLDAKMNDASDFSEQAVWQIRRALTEAFNAGKAMR